MPQAESNLRDRFAPIVFPNDRSELDGMYMTLEVIRYRYKLRNNDNRQKQVLGSIRLPLPPNLATAYRSNYNNEPLGVAGNFSAREGEVFETSGFVSSIKAIFKQDLAGLGGGAANLAVQRLEQGLEGGGFANARLRDSIRGLGAGVGISRNPHEAVLFKGPTFRTHNFNYKLVPRNRADTNSIYEIIYRLKRSMLPLYIHADHFFDYPFMFETTFSPSVRDFLFDIGPSFLTNMSVNYHGEGLAQYTEYGPGSSIRAPLSISLGLTLLESTITTRDDVDHPTEGR